MMIIAPTILCHVMGSPNKQYANNITNTKLVPLNIYAIDKSTHFNTCCQQIAYPPITPRAPNRPHIYCHDKNSCCEVYLVNSDTQAYSKLIATKIMYINPFFTTTNDRYSSFLLQQNHSSRINGKQVYLPTV